MDPQLRLLLELVWEAIINAGQNPIELRGRNIGVYVGCSGSETAVALMQRSIEKMNGRSLNGCTMAMMSNQLSFAFDFRGPSMTVDTACSSSLVCLELATNAIRLRQCDAAIVAGHSFLNVVAHTLPQIK